MYNLRSENGFVKSYLNYQGIRINEGLWKDGRSIACFSFESSSLKREKNNLLRFEVGPGIFGSDFQVDFFEMKNTTANPFFEDYVWDLGTGSEFKNLAEWNQYQSKYFRKKNPNCKPGKIRKFLTYKPDRAGWHQVEILSHLSKQGRVLVQLSHIELSDGKRSRVNSQNIIGRGIRLPAYFGRDRNKLSTNDLFIRRPDWDSRRLYLMNDKKARQDFYNRNEPKDWRTNPALWQMNHLRLGKYYTNWYGFNPEQMIQVRFLDKLISYWKKRSKFLLINNPENPVTLDVYEWTSQKNQQAAWYRKYQNHLKKICKSKTCGFVDGHRQLTEKYFLDSHHLTYEGMLRMAPRYAKWIEKSFAVGD